MTPPAAGSTLVMALLLLWTHLTAADTVASTASQTGEFAPQQPQTPPLTMVGHDGAVMLLVPAGEFLMGNDADEIGRLALQQEFVEDEMPRHRVYLDTFAQFIGVCSKTRRHNIRQPSCLTKCA